ncbi:MAG: GNAT family N-acetyltransferase [Dysgonomonas sp.]
MKSNEYTIRPWKLTDSRRLAENANNPRIWNNVRDYFPHPYTEKDAKVFIKQALKKNNTEDFAIAVNGEAVGGIGFVPGWDVERLNAEIGYWLGENYWGKGIMSAALKDVIDYVFSNTDFIRLFTSVYEYNKASMRVLEKVGFRKVGVMKRAAVKNNTIIDLHSYELLKP